MLTFRKIGYTAAIVAAGVLGATAASATTYNFESTPVTESGVVDGTLVAVGSGGELVGVSGFEFAAGTISGKGNFAYFDDKSGKLAGLGACSKLSGTAQCNPASDDNVTTGEAVGINFGDGTLNTVTFRGTKIGGGGDSHSLLAKGDTFLFSLDGVVFKQGVVGAGGVWTAGVAVNNVNGIYFATDAYELYIASADYSGKGNPNGGPNPVPLPAGGLLLLTALAGLGAARKRAKKS
jgi:hypothetical protein